jgi:hypothetical protein
MATVNAVTIDIALDMLRGCLAAGGEVKPGGHFRDELRNEGLTFPAAWHVLKTGCIYEPPENDIRTGEWRYKVEGHEPDGKWLAIVFCFKNINRAYLITVFSVTQKTRSV